MIARIVFTKPPGSDRDEIAQFILDALSSWGGQFRPDDPLFRSLKLTKLIVAGKSYEIAQEEEQTP